MPINLSSFINLSGKLSSATMQISFFALPFFLVFSDAALAETPLSYRASATREIAGKFYPEIPYCQEYKKILLERTLKKSEYEVSSDGWYIDVTNKSNWTYQYFRIFDGDGKQVEGDGKQLGFKHPQSFEVAPNDVTTLRPDFTGFASKLVNAPSIESLKPKIFSVKAFGYDIRCAKKLPEQEIIALQKKDAENARLERLEGQNYDLCIVSLLPETASSEIKRTYKRICRRFSKLDFPTTKNK